MSDEEVLWWRVTLTCVPGAVAVVLLVLVAVRLRQLRRREPPAEVAGAGVPGSARRRPTLASQTSRPSVSESARGSPPAARAPLRAARPERAADAPPSYTEATVHAV